MRIWRPELLPCLAFLSPPHLGLTSTSILWVNLVPEALKEFLPKLPYLFLPPPPREVSCG